MNATTDLTETVAKDKVRKHFAAARTIERNVRLKRYNGRNSRSTEQALDYHYRQAAHALIYVGRQLHGLLWSEHQLVLRIAENKEQGNERPELKARLNTIRREIKELTR